MAEMAKAAVLVGPREVEIQEFPLPDIGPNEGLMKIEASGVCGADIPPFNGKNLGAAHLGMNYPVILGHEIVGIVDKLGSEAATRWGVQEGDRIILERWIPCGHCDHCYNGNYRFCLRSVDGSPLFYGGSPTTLTPSLWGGFADYLYLHPDSVIYPVSKKIPAEVYPLFTPIGNGISWATRSGGARIGSTVVIQGPGQEGMGALIAARAAGASTVIVTGLARDKFRLDIARELGAAATVVADEEDVVERVKEITNGELADVVVDVTSGANPAPVALSVDLARHGGTIVLASRHQDVPLSEFAASKITQKTLSIHGVRGRHRESVKAALRLIESGAYPLERLCTHTFPVEETAKALRLAAGEEGEDVFHVSVTP